LQVFRSVNAESVVIYPYAHLSSQLAEPKKAVEVLKTLEMLIKAEGLRVIRAPFGWYKAFTLSCYGHPLSELSKRVGKSSSPPQTRRERVPEEPCAKFGFPSSPHAYFLRRAILHFLAKAIKADTIVEGDLDQKDKDIDLPTGAIGLYYRPSDNEVQCYSLRVAKYAIYRGDYEPGFLPQKIGELQVWDKRGEYTLVDLDLSAYSLVLKGMEENPPSLPVWASPIQVRIIPLVDLAEALKVAERIRGRVDIDDLNERLANKIRRAGKEWIPYTVILGDRELSTNSLTVRMRVTGEQRSMTVEELNQELLKADPIGLQSSMPKLLSKRPQLPYLK
jgi:Threonyl-tRNA synthetase